jgi:uncharacterized membrane protein (DUF373 family)
MRGNGLGAHFSSFKRNWLTLSLYERFEQVIALILTWLIGVIIVVAVWDLTKQVAFLAWRGFPRPLEHETFQAIFGQIMTVLIALEFKHSIIKVVAARESIIQVKTVLLIALLAVARKFIILDAKAFGALTIVALAAVVVALGAAHWLVGATGARERASNR